MGREPIAGAAAPPKSAFQWETRYCPLTRWISTRSNDEVPLMDTPTGVAYVGASAGASVWSSKGATIGVAGDRGRAAAGQRVGRRRSSRRSTASRLGRGRRGWERRDVHEPNFVFMASPWLAGSRWGEGAKRHCEIQLWI